MIMLRNIIDYASEPQQIFSSHRLYGKPYFSSNFPSKKHLFINLYYILALPEYKILRQVREKSQMKRTCGIDITDFKH